jgi:alkylhydroperoxidase family enzyme
MYRDPAGRMQEFTGRSQRVDPLHDAVLDDGTEEVLARLRAEFQYAPTEEKHDFFGTLARSPDVCRAYLELGTALAVTGTLPARERELVILRTGWLCGAPYEFGEHVVVGRRVGLTDEEIQRVALGAAAEGWAPRERVLLRAVEELHADAMIADTTWAGLAEHFDDRQLVELPVLVGHYHLTAFVQNALRIPLNSYNRGLAHASGERP